jgi:hypothetical protein
VEFDAALYLDGVFGAVFLDFGKSTANPGTTFPSLDRS